MCANLWFGRKVAYDMLRCLKGGNIGANYGFGRWAIYDIFGYLGERRYIGCGTQVIYGLIIARVQIY